MSCSPESHLPIRRFRLLAGLLSLLLIPAAFAEPPARDDGTDVFLVTYGPGEIYWQRFGHNAIWVRDRGLGLDHTFNFGFFDFEQEDFFLRFLRGRMLYFAAARPAREEFAEYIDENRTIRAQKLDLGPSQKLELVESLLMQVRPENRNYRYDYYLDNCSTRVRDALDEALGGMLKQEFSARPAPFSWRDHTRRLTGGDFWLYLGLQVGLGPPVDRQISRWEEMFVPGKLADYLETIEFSGDGVGRPLVTEDVLLFESTLEQPPAEPQSLWPRYLLLAAAGLLAGFLLSRRICPVALARAWLALTGLAGLALAFLWFGTDHAVARYNMNLLLFNPLWLLPAFAPAARRSGALLALFCALLSLLMVFLPLGQYNRDVLAAFLPLNIAAAWLLVRSRLRPAIQPGVPAAADR
jgi:hypothetical protein